MGLRTICFGFLISASAVQVRAGEPLNLRVSPMTAFAPATVTIRTVIESDPDNRVVEITAESDDFYRSSEIPLEGDKAPRTTTLELRSLPAGSYQVKARLFGADGHERATVTRDISIVATGSN
jgi:hypothetical protein